MILNLTPVNTPHQKGLNLIFAPVFLGNALKHLKNTEKYRYKLSLQEQERAAKFHRETDYNCYICAHFFLRYYYSMLSNIPIEELVLNYPDNNKPYFLNSNIDFNISHSQEYFALVIAKNEDVKVGIDIEVVNPINDFLNIAKSYFHPAEYNYIQELSDHKGRTSRFYEIWTRKEAYLKMIGTGLIYDLAAINTLENNHKDKLFTHTYTNGAICLSIAVSPFCEIQFKEITTY